MSLLFVPLPLGFSNFNLFLLIELQFLKVVEVIFFLKPFYNHYKCFSFFSFVHFMFENTIVFSLHIIALLDFTGLVDNFSFGGCFYNPTHMFILFWFPLHVRFQLIFYFPSFCYNSCFIIFTAL